MTMLEKGRILKLDAVIVRYNPNPRIYFETTRFTVYSFVSLSTNFFFFDYTRHFFQPEPGKNDFSRRYLDTFYSITVEYVARRRFTDKPFQRTKEYRSTIILSRIIGQRFVRARDALQKEREKEREIERERRQQRRRTADEQTLKTSGKFSIGRHITPGISARFVSPFSNFHKSGSKRELS